MNITITKNEYTKLKRDALAYRKIAASIFKKSVSDPIIEIVEDFKASKIYSDNFITDLENGLKKSSLSK